MNIYNNITKIQKNYFLVLKGEFLDNLDSIYLGIFDNLNLSKRIMCKNLASDKEIIFDSSIIIFKCQKFEEALKLFWGKNPINIDEMAIFV